MEGIEYQIERSYPRTLGSDRVVRAVVRGRLPQPDEDEVLYREFERRFPDTMAGRLEALAWTEAKLRVLGATAPKEILKFDEIIEIEARARAIIAAQLGVSREEVTLEKSFLGDLGADSLDIVDLVMEFEDAFAITIADEEAEQATTVGKAIALIISRKGGQP